MTLAQRFKKIDTLKAKLAAEERALKADIRNFADANGLKALPRPEQVRSMLNA